jgi:hypothetical protein
MRNCPVTYEGEVPLVVLDATDVHTELCSGLLVYRPANVAFDWVQLDEIHLGQAPYDGK